MEVKRWTYATALTPASELDVQSGRMKTFVYASRGNVPDLMTVREGATVTTYRFATDHLGSVRMVVNASCPQTFADAYASCVVWHADYDEYGRRTLIKGQSDPEMHPFGFAGGHFDHETGLSRFGVRDYDAYTGRWTTRDLILFDGGDSNLYAYVGNDPVNFVDPLGLDRLRFDGDKVEWQADDGSVLASWKSTSGGDGGKGPTPEGHYKTSYKDFKSRIDDDGDWGRYSFKLNPDGATRARIRKIGREPDTFYIHGGDVPGTHGCTQLGNDDLSDLARRLKAHGGPIDVIVEYSESAKRRYRIQRLGPY